MARDHDAKNDGDPVPERPSSDLFTAEQARAMLEEFRAMVREGILEVTPGNEVLQVEKPVEPKSDPRESSPSIFSEEGVRFFNRRVSERLRESAREEPEPPAPEPVARRAAPRESLVKLRQEVVARVADRILEQWDPDSLREGLVEQLVSDLLLRLERERK